MLTHKCATKIRVKSIEAAKIGANDSIILASRLGGSNLRSRIVSLECLFFHYISENCSRENILLCIFFFQVPHRQKKSSSTIHFVAIPTI